MRPADGSINAIFKVWFRALGRELCSLGTDKNYICDSTQCNRSDRLVVRVRGMLLALVWKIQLSKVKEMLTMSFSSRSRTTGVKARGIILQGNLFPEWFTEQTKANSVAQCVQLLDPMDWSTSGPPHPSSLTPGLLKLMSIKVSGVSVSIAVCHPINYISEISKFGKDMV